MNSEIDAWDSCQDLDELIMLIQKSTEDKESSIRLSSVLGILLVAVLKPDYYNQLVTYLKSLLINDDLYIRGSAALTIGILGTDLDDPIPFLDMLKLLLFDETRFVQRNASIGLAYISSATVSKRERFSLIEKLLSSDYWYFRMGGAIGLGYFCEKSDLIDVINRLKPILNDSDTDVRISAVYGLGIIAKRFDSAKRLIPLFKACLFDYDPAVIHSAKIVLCLLKI